MNNKKQNDTEPSKPPSASPSGMPSGSDDALDNELQSATAGDDAIDEELLALSPPPPSLQQAIFIVMIIGFSFVLLYLFWPEMRYFLKGFVDPVPLGEAADLQSKALESDSFVKVDGVPLVNRTVTFSTGTKWFSGDIFRKMAPISGNPNLLVQWHTPNPEIKQANDALTPPASFAGRLKLREDLSENYNKFWPFYDCLKVHSTSQCKFCIGKSNMDECRPIFTCVDNYPIELCDQTAFNTREELEKKVAKLKSEVQSDTSEAVARELAQDERALAALENINTLSELVVLEELFDRLSLLAVPEARNGDILALKKTLFAKQMNALEILLRMPIEKIASLSGALRQKLREEKANLERVEAELAELSRQEQALGPLLDVSTEVAEFVALVREQQRKLRRIDQSTAPLAEWKLDGNETGLVLLNRVRDLSAMLSEMKLSPKNAEEDKPPVAVDTESADASAVSTDTDAEPQTDSAEKSASEAASAQNSPAQSNDAQDAVPPPVPRSPIDAQTETDLAPLEDPVLSAIDTQLNQAVARVAEIGRKLIRLSPGESPALDKWARSTDIVGSLPKPLRADHVFKAFEQLKEMLANVEPASEQSLKARYRSLLDTKKEKQALQKKLSATSGLAELELVDRWEALKKSTGNIKSEPELKAAVNRLHELSGLYARQEFYPRDLSNYPEVQKALRTLLNDADLPSLTARVTALESEFASPMYILLDDEKPTDNPWILFVYIVVPLMLVINIRKLLRFIAEWRQYGL